MDRIYKIVSPALKLSFGKVDFIISNYSVLLSFTERKIWNYYNNDVVNAGK